jgi:hypothetical protein
MGSRPIYLFFVQELPSSRRGPLGYNPFALLLRCLRLALRGPPTSSSISLPGRARLLDVPLVDDVVETSEMARQNGKEVSYPRNR